MEIFALATASITSKIINHSHPSASILKLPNVGHLTKLLIFSSKFLTKQLIMLLRKNMHRANCSDVYWIQRQQFVYILTYHNDQYNGIYAKDIKTCIYVKHNNDDDDDVKLQFKIALKSKVDCMTFCCFCLETLCFSLSLVPRKWALLAFLHFVPDCLHSFLELWSSTKGKEPAWQFSGDSKK